MTFIDSVGQPWKAAKKPEKKDNFIVYLKEALEDMVEKPPIQPELKDDVIIEEDVDEEMYYPVVNKNIPETVFIGGFDCRQLATQVL